MAKQHDIPLSNVNENHEVKFKDTSEENNVGSSMNERKALLCFDDVRCFVVVLASTIWLHATMAIYGTTILTTLEKRYNLSSSQLGFLVSIGQIGTLTSIIPVAYIGGRPSSHRPRWMGIGVLVLAVGIFTASLPHFVVGPYGYEDINLEENTTTGIHTCFTNQSIVVDSECEETGKDISRDSKVAYALVAMGLMITGAGYSPFMTLGTTFVDDHATHEKSALYLGLVNMMWGIGPIMATFIAAGSLLLYVDFNRMNDSTINITSDDDEWVGAWWLGLLGGSILGFLLAIPYAFIPKELKNKTSEGQSDSTTKRQNTDDSGSSQDLSQLGLRGFLRSSWRLVTNYTFMIVLIAYALDLGSTFGVVSFIPKYLELQFGFQPSTANILLGALGLVPYAIGMILGGYLIKKLKLGVFGMQKMVMMVFGAGMILILLLYPLACDSYHVVGIGENRIDKTQPCNVDCQCSIDLYSPVCGNDGNTYTSACHAGCTVYGGNNTYTDCG
ncbi:solute carrier organic anion transporter family member 1B3-like, partial [Glandiceps talaboti]